jgi:uncharacterized protein YggE
MVSDPAAAEVDRPTVRVRGEAAIRTEPDEAIVWISLSALDQSPGPALADVAKRSAALAELMDELGIARRDRSTTGVTVSEEFDHTSEGRRSLGHRAVASMSVRVDDTTLIGRLVMRASDELAARIAGPSWRISAGNPARLQAATQAAENARAKAAAYAAGVDARLGAVLSLSEPGDDHGSLSVRAARAAAPDLNVEAGEQEVLAVVTATFALETG